MDRCIDYGQKAMEIETHSLHLWKQDPGVTWKDVMISRFLSTKKQECLSHSSTFPATHSMENKQQITRSP